jgi:hypothetical protein
MIGRVSSACAVGLLVTGLAGAAGAAERRDVYIGGKGSCPYGVLMHEHHEDPVTGTTDIWICYLPITEDRDA